MYELDLFRRCVRSWATENNSMYVGFANGRSKSDLIWKDILYIYTTLVLLSTILVLVERNTSGRETSKNIRKHVYCQTVSWAMTLEYQIWQIKTDRNLNSYRSDCNVYCSWRFTKDISSLIKKQLNNDTRLIKRTIMIYFSMFHR